MPLIKHIVDSFSLSQACTVSATLFLIVPLSPVLISLSFFLFFSFLITVPILCILISAYLFFSILSRFSVRSFLKLSLLFCLRILDSTNNSNTSTKSAADDEVCDDNQVSVVFDPSEVPSFDEGDDESEESASIYDHDRAGEKKKPRETINDSNTLLNVQPMKSFNPFDDGSFYEILTFWKKKDKGFD